MPRAPFTYGGVAPEYQEHSTNRSLLSPILGGAAIGGVIALGLVNGESIAFNARAAFDTNDLNNETSAIAQELLHNEYVRVDCSSEKLDKLIERDSTYAGTNYELEGVVLPFNGSVFTYAPPVITLRDEYCTALTGTPSELLMPETDKDLEQNYPAIVEYMYAAGVLMHEGQHVAQVYDEAKANCYALQKLPTALEGLGVEEPFATWGAEIAASEMSAGIPESYLDFDRCAPGGEYDLNLNGVFIKPTVEENW